MTIVILREWGRSNASERPMDLIVYEGILVGMFVLTIVLVAYLV